MATSKTKEDSVETSLEQVEVPSSTEALAQAVADGKKEESEYVTDTTNAREVVNLGGHLVVRW